MLNRLSVLLPAEQKHVFDIAAERIPARTSDLESWRNIAALCGPYNAVNLLQFPSYFDTAIWNAAAIIASTSPYKAVSLFVEFLLNSLRWRQHYSVGISHTDTVSDTSPDINRRMCCAC